MKTNWNTKIWSEIATRGTSGDQVWDIIGDFETLEEICRELLQAKSDVLRYSSAPTVDYPAFLQAHEVLDAAYKKMKSFLNQELTQGGRCVKTAYME